MTSPKGLQQQLLAEFANGLTGKEIATTLGLKLTMVNIYVRDFRSRFEAPTIAKAVASAIRTNEIRFDGEKWVAA